MEQVTYPVTKEKKIALDGVEFTIYTQRFVDGRVAVGGWAVNISDRTKFRIWTSEEFEDRNETWEEYLDDPAN